jgi:hypothetical protein
MTDPHEPEGHDDEPDADVEVIKDLDVHEDIGDDVAGGSGGISHAPGQMA